ncbi:restriction endonuclease subunit S [Lacticaseibacillus paracasei]|uniref:restriction endonuclease subunit S n=1 Tax=Lacticaseibacillus paracasei TaxID=1597 RepID=UPI003DAA0D5E
MSKDAKNVPALRFKGYSDAWEKRKLGDVVERVTRKNRDLVSTRPLTISAQDGLVDQRKFFSKTVASKNISNYFLLKAGDFAYNKSYSVGYPWGAVKRLDKYPSGVLSTLYIVFKPKKINSQFLVTYFEGTTWYVSVSKVASEGARNHGLLNISASDFFDQQLFFPTKKTEQESIGFTIKVLDDLIAATQYSIDALEQAKKALLQRLFDQSWRFKGHSDPWEKRKLQELLVERNDPSIESKTYPLMSFTGTDGVTPKGRRYDRSALVKSSSKKYKKTQKNDLIYSSNNLETGSIGLNKTGNAVISPVYSVFQVTDEAIPSFMGNMILRRRFIDKMLRYRQGIMYGQWRIHELDFLQIVVNVPQTAEQFQIGQLFSALDALIAATQSRLSSLELLKKSLLQDLFI